VAGTRSGSITHTRGRAVAEAIGRWFPTVAALGSNPGLVMWICGGQSGAGTGFLRVLRFLLSIFIRRISPQSSSPIIRGWYNRPVVAAVPKSPTAQIKKKKDEFSP
jgi:hypothetical protein